MSKNESLEFANEEPCYSMASLVTYLVIINEYPVSIEFEKQEALLKSISTQILMPWQEVLDLELIQVQTECAQSDIDFEFLVDSSGSVGITNWELTMQIIGEWIREIIVPLGSKYCGNHVAGRWFSSNSERFHDFMPPSREVYAPLKYSDYVANVFSAVPFNSGGTATADAIKAVRQVDIPTARQDELKYVMVFTDGQSNSGQDVEGESRQLHEVVDRTYAIGITNGINYDELLLIASQPNYTEALNTLVTWNPLPESL